MKIEVLGPGCAKCKKMYEAALQAVDQAGIEAVVQKVENIKAIADYGVLMTPALVVDGVVKSSGKVLKPAAIISLIRR